MEDKKKKRRRQPGASVKRPPQKAPHAQPRRNPAPVSEPTRTAPEVVYMAPKPFSRNRLFLQLATIAAVVIAVLLGLSIFFKVEKIEVSGCSQYTAWEIQQASGIEVGDQLLTLNGPKAIAKIIEALPYVKSVRSIGISLPDTVKIEIVETRVTYALQDREGNYWLMDSDGKLLEQCPAGKEKEHTLVAGVVLEKPTVGAQAIPYEQTTSDPAAVTADRKLAAVKSIAVNLERNGIIGQAASMDVESLFEIELWYKNKFLVLLGDTTRMETKLAYLKSFVETYEKEKPYEKGTLDLSNPDRIQYHSAAEEE